jgi:hypothetical protein
MKEPKNGIDNNPFNMGCIKNGWLILIFTLLRKG